jgi:thioesterase domain-containing protein
MRVIAEINTRLGAHVAVRTLFQAPSVRTLSRQLGTPASELEVVPVEVLKAGIGAPLFCIHPGGGMSWPYQRLGHYLDCPIIGIQQLLQGDEAEPESIREMARNYADRIQGVDPAGPYNLLGWSFGGLVAHELAIELRQRGYEIGRLIILDAQFSLEGATLPNNPLEDKQMLEETFRFCGIDIPEQDEPITYEQLEKVMLERGVTEFPRYKRLVDWLIQNFNGNMELQRMHEPRVFDGDISIFSAARDQSDRGSYLIQAWQPYVAGDITEYSVDCPHEEMLTVESLNLYGQQLKLLLET